MRTFFVGLLAAAVLVAFGVPARAATETVTGKLIDKSCYDHDKTATGNDHKMGGKDVTACAAACAKKGQPVALLTSDGKVYTVKGGLAAENNAKLVAHMGHTVAITGDVTTANGAMTISSDAVKMISR
jgi:predicted transcriptional regulator